MEVAERQWRAKEEKGQEVSSPTGSVTQPHSHLCDQHKEMLRMLLSSKPLGYELCYGRIQESLASLTFRNKTEFPTLRSDPKH